MAMPCLKIGAGAARIENPERSPKIPQRPPGTQRANHLQRIVVPRVDHFRRRVFIAAHFPEMYGNVVLAWIGPRYEFVNQRLLVDNHLSSRILQRPSRKRTVVAIRFRPLMLELV